MADINPGLSISVAAAERDPSAVELGQVQIAAAVSQNDAAAAAPAQAAGSAPPQFNLSLSAAAIGSPETPNSPSNFVDQVAPDKRVRRSSFVRQQTRLNYAQKKHGVHRMHLLGACAQTVRDRAAVASKMRRFCATARSRTRCHHGLDSDHRLLHAQVRRTQF